MRNSRIEGGTARILFCRLARYSSAELARSAHCEAHLRRIHFIQSPAKCYAEQYPVSARHLSNAQGCERTNFVDGLPIESSGPLIAISPIWDEDNSIDDVVTPG